MSNVKKRLPRNFKSALTDLGIISAYEALDWADELIAKLFPGAGEIPEEIIDEVANLVTLGLLTGAPYAYDRLYGEKTTRDEYIERMKRYGKAALIEAGEVLPLTDFIPAYHWAWLELYYPNVAEGVKKIVSIGNFAKRFRQGKTSEAYT